MVMAFLLHDKEQCLPKYRGSVKGRLPAAERGREEDHAQTMDALLSSNQPHLQGVALSSMFADVKGPVLKIIHGVWCYDDYFNLKPDATCKLGFTSYQKCTAAIRMLAYGVAGDLVESVCLGAMYMFCRVVFAVFA
jgi:hypothetical protein